MERSREIQNYRIFHLPDLISCRKFIEIIGCPWNLIIASFYVNCLYTVPRASSFHKTSDQPISPTSCDREFDIRFSQSCIFRFLEKLRKLNALGTKYSIILINISYLMVPRAFYFSEIQSPTFFDFQKN